MALIPRIFGKGKAEPEKPSSQAPMIKVFDSYGREFQMSRETYLRDGLLPSFEKNKSNPEALYGTIVQALRDGFAEEALEPARRLAKIDPDASRGDGILGVVLLQLKRYDEARVVLEGAIATLGEQGYLLTNLAKAYSGLGDHKRSEQILWHALELDPNQENGVAWYAVIFKGHEGEAGLFAAYARIAALPGSWRAQLWQARAALERQDVEAAVKLYREVLGKLEDVPTDALMQISGDLGNHGQLALIIELCQPRFDAKIHGIQVGNNLIKAYVELKDPDSAREILAQLTALKRMDWQKHLLYWDDQIDKSRAQFGPVEASGKLEVGIYTLDQPIWARGVLGFESLLPKAQANAPRILFCCGSGDPGVNEHDPVTKQPSNELGRVTRALPMFLAEEMQIRGVPATFVLPWLNTGGFVLSAKPWVYKDMKADQIPHDFALMLHIDAKVTPWRMHFSLLKAPEGSQFKAWEESFDPQDTGAAILASLDKVSRAVGAVARGLAPNDLTAPPATNLPHYLGASEQALAVSTAVSGKEGSGTLYGERSIVENLLFLAVNTPTNVRIRCLLLNTVEKETRRRPDIVREYLDKLKRLQMEHPIRGGAAAELIAGAMATVEAKIVAN